MFKNTHIKDICGPCWTAPTDKNKQVLSKVHPFLILHSQIKTTLKAINNEKIIFSLMVYFTGLMQRLDKKMTHDLLFVLVFTIGGI